MYSQADLDNTRARLKARWIRVLLPCALMLAGVIASFVVLQAKRDSRGWIVTWLLSVLLFGGFTFFYGVYIKPLVIYARHLEYMLHGRMRDTTGVVREIADRPCDKDGLSCYRMIINVGERADPEDDRLLYYDALLGRPPVNIGDRVSTRSNDKVISDMTVV